MWDSEVDIVSVGAGIGALACAIASVDFGADVLVTDAAPLRGANASILALRERVSAKRGWLLSRSTDLATDEYFAALSEGIDGLAATTVETPIPVSVARNLSKDEANSRSVQPFVGSTLNAWAAQCLASPYGMLCSSVLGWPTTTMRTEDGQSIEAFRIGSAGWSGGTLGDWVTEQASQRDIEVQTDRPLERLVFEDGFVTGVVLSTPSGPFAVRARIGVTVAPSGQDSGAGIGNVDSSDDDLQVCLVGRTASRFGRLELLTTAPESREPVCTTSGRQLRESMHDTHQGRLDGWRCGKVH